MSSGQGRASEHSRLLSEHSGSVVEFGALAAVDAAASFEALVAMHRDVTAVQARMGDELARLATSLGKQPPPPQPQRPSCRPQLQPPSSRCRPSVQPPSSRGRLSGRHGSGGAPPPAAPSSSRQQIIEEEETGGERDGDPDWVDTARKFLPAWAKPAPPRKAAAAADMSA